MPKKREEDDNTWMVAETKTTHARMDASWKHTGTQLLDDIITLCDDARYLYIANAAVIIIAVVVVGDDNNGDDIGRHPIVACRKKKDIARERVMW